MTHARHALVALALSVAACQAEDDGNTDDTDVTVTPDPHVNTFLPEGLTLDDPVRVVFLGDSITAGVGAARDELAYPALLQENDDDKWDLFADADLDSLFGELEVVDVSRGGATTDTMRFNQLPRLEAELGSTPASGQTLVVFTIGGNDAQAALNPFADPAEIIDETLANMEAIIDLLQDEELFAEPPAIYATNIYEPTDGTGQTDSCFLGFDFSNSLPELKRYNDEFRDMARDRGFAAVDLRGHFLGHGFERAQATRGYDPDDDTLWLDDDCIHPNNRGHHEIRRLFFHAIAGEDLPLDPRGKVVSGGDADTE